MKFLEYLNKLKRGRIWGRVFYETENLSRKEVLKAIKIGLSFRNKYFKEEKIQRFAKYGPLISVIIGTMATIKMRIFRRCKDIFNWIRRTATL